MKHLLWFKKVKHQISLALEKNTTIQVPCEDMSYVPFVLSLIKQKKIFILGSSDLNDALGYFDLHKKQIAVLPNKRSNLSIEGIVDFDHQLYNINVNKCQHHWEKINLCVVDEGLYTRRLFSKRVVPLYEVVGGKKIEREHVLDVLVNRGFHKRNRLEVPGEYVVRGGVVDISPFDSLSFYRLSFLNESGVEVFLINKKDSFIQNQVERVALTTGVRPQEKSLSDMVEKKDLLVYFKNKTLTIKKQRKGGVGLAVVFENYFNYSFYLKNKEKQFLFSPLLQKGGVIVAKNIHVVPLWYKKTTKENNKTPLAPNMNKGDIFVHERFGFCRYVGVETSVDNSEKICLEFEDGKIKIDISKINSIFFFSDKNRNKKLSSLSKKGLWKRTQKKHKLMAQDFVDSLFFSYQKRKNIKRKNCSLDRNLEGLFIENFKHKATQDQIKTTKEIYKDLISTSPMTRLLCGDVGFGKTEVALRAAFLCISNSKKVVVVSPTRILSQQLFNVFNERFNPFGVIVTSSFSKYLKNDSCILVSTHKALNNKEVLLGCRFLIIDEEHRFGVKQKEEIIKINPLCDILYMSATPLPRSLQLSLSEQRNISLISTPPLSKKQIITRVYFYNKNLIKEAIYNETNRGGQVFVVDKSVNNVRSAFSFINKAFPLLRVACLYASLNFDVIKKTMVAFRSKKIDVLVSTTIIESGIDVGGANTIIINNADFFGLSQLYQLRGRVGRSSVQAHAFLFVDKKQTPGATLRLKSLIKNQSLGSGYNIAFDDLSLRGAGSLFGYKQSGGSGVGFEYYSNLVSRAFSFYNKKTSNSCVVVLGEGFVPFQLIPSASERIHIYKTVSSCARVSDLLEYYNRFSSLFKIEPFPFYCLIKNKQIEILLSHSCFSSIVFGLSGLSLSLEKKSTFFSKDYILKTKTFLNKNVSTYEYKENLFDIKIQLNKSLKDCYILLVNLLGDLNAK